MSSLRLLARQLNVSRTTVSAALRGHPWVKASTRMQVIKCAQRHGYIHATTNPSGTKKIAVLRMSNGTRRGRVGMERHQVITRGVKEAADYLHYETEKFLTHVTNGELPSTLCEIKARKFSGIIILPGDDLDTLPQISDCGLPCIYTDIPPDHTGINCVHPDYHQALHIALNRLRSMGFNKPGLILDNDLSATAREQLISAYRSGVSPLGSSTPPVFFAARPSAHHFDIWLRKHAFDCLLTTDIKTSSRLYSAFGPPSFGVYAEAQSTIGGLNINLTEVGRLAVDTLHNQLAHRERVAPPTNLVVPATWTTRWRAAEVARWACAS